LKEKHPSKISIFCRGTTRRALLLAPGGWIILLMIFLLTLTTTAHQQTTPSPRLVQITAADGLTLAADYFPPRIDSDQPYPVVLLLHMIGSDRQSWSPLIPALLESGYAVLAVDLRGHGETGGEINWPAATTDVQTWLDWMHSQSDIQPNSLSVIGASIGANLALIGCSNDPGCVTAVALSPGLDYYGLGPRRSIVGNLSTRSALLIASQIDTYSADSVKELMSSATGDIGARLFAQNAHGTNLLLHENIAEPLMELILDWLNEHSLNVIE
jgi:pimeloyl-ACP methyl ester carboxylesterase